MAALKFFGAWVCLVLAVVLIFVPTHFMPPTAAVVFAVVSIAFSQAPSS